MSRAAAFNVYRSCAASFASRNATRSSLPFAARRVAGVRYYSDANAQSQSNDGAPEVPGSEKKEGNGAEQHQPSPAEAECLEKLKKKEAEAVDLQSRLRYLQADFLNLQRNAAREKEQTKDFAISKFAGDLLETVDVLSMALKSVPQSAIEQASSSSSSSSPDSSSEQKGPEAHLRDLYTGVEMTHRLLLQTLFKYGVKPFDPTGDKFDPNRHEALYQAPVPGKEPGTVLQCQKIGYTIKDRVLRAAQVGVVQDTQS
ncbi:GrpE-domain-containing protein [Panus rudis PR-1116 ss-1]|nr:GrpE-domain-containing protein [Panus rudis PR-1116 ss-1]